MRPDDKSDFFDTTQLATWLGVSKRSVERMRADETGPPVTFVRGRARYHREGVLAWTRDNLRRKRSRPAPARGSDLTATNEHLPGPSPEDAE